MKEYKIEIMSLPRYTSLDSLKTVDEIDKEIFCVEKKLFDLRIKRAVTQGMKPHLYRQAKRQLAQLKFKRTFLLKT